MANPAKETLKFGKAHFGAFLLLVLLVVLIVVAYEVRNPGKLSAKIGKLPLIGKRITTPMGPAAACFLVFFGCLLGLLTGDAHAATRTVTDYATSDGGLLATLIAMLGGGLVALGSTIGSDPEPLFKQQSAQSGGEVATLDPGGRATFIMENFPTLLGDLWPYMQAVWVGVRFQVTNLQSTGRIIFPDEFWKLFSSLSLRSPDLGQIYSKQITRGPWMGYLAQIISNGYRLPYKYTDPIPADNGTHTREIWLRLPLGHRVMLKGHQMAPWNGFMKKAKLEVDLADADVLGVGATVEEAMNVGCAVEYTPEPEARIHTMGVWRMYESAANARLHVIQQVGGGDGLNGVKPGCRHGFFGFMAKSDGAGGSSFLGLGGSALISDIASVEYPGRNQESLQVDDLAGTGVGQAFMRELETRKDSLVDPEGRWPIDLALAGGPIVNDRNPGTAVLAYHAPTKQQQVTKLQKHYGDIQINHEYIGATPPGTPQWLSFEIFEYQDKQKEFFRERMGIASNVSWRPKLASGKGSVTESKKDGIPDKFNVPVS